MSSLREKLVFVFQEFLASVSKVFILAGRQGTRLSFYEDFGICGNCYIIIALRFTCGERKIW